jgi:hypothetical protein
LGLWCKQQEVLSFLSMKMTGSSTIVERIFQYLELPVIGEQCETAGYRYVCL